jgi:putative hydroxymethylpyrimidine transport system substrate-binding protein
VKETNVGFNLVPAMISGRVAATLGAFWNYEGVDLARRGRDPVIQHVERLGVPNYDELVFVARRADLNEDFAAKVRRFMQATARGYASLKSDPGAGVDALMKAAPDLDRGLQEASVKATLPAFFPPADRPFGFMDESEWQRYADWMLDQGLIKQPQHADEVLTNEFLPGEGLDPGTISQD